MLSYEQKTEGIVIPTSQRNYLLDCTIADNVNATSNFKTEEFTEIFNKHYNSNTSNRTININNKHSYNLVLSTILKDNNYNRTTDNMYYWNGLYYLDLDLDKEIKNICIGKTNQIQSIKELTIDSVKSDLQKVIDFCNDKKITYKTSASGFGIHLFLNINIGKNISEEATISLRDLVFKGLNNHFQSIIDTMEFNYHWNIDEGLRKNLTLGIALAPSDNYKDYTHYIVDINDLREKIDFSAFKNVINTKNSNIKIIHNYNNDSIAKLKEDIINLPNFNPIWKNEDRIVIIPLLKKIGFSEEYVVNFMKNKSSNATKEEIKSIYKWSNCDYDYSMQRLLFEVKKHTGISIEFDDKTVEVINSDLLLEINKYCTEKQNEIFDFFDNNDKILFQSPTGSGKSKIIIEYARKYINENPNKKVVIACDTIVLADQISTQNNLSVLSSNKNNTLRVTDSNNSGIYVSTYDSLEKIDSIDCLIIDEAHLITNAISYREKALYKMVDKMDRVTKCICVSATPDYLYPLINSFKILKIESKTIIINNFFNLKDEKSTAVNKIISHLILKPLNGKCIIYINDIKTLNKIKERIVKEFNNKYNVVVYHSSNDNIGLDIIQKQSLIPNDIDIILTTSILQNGVNILNTDIDRCYTDELEKTSLKQFESRFRNGNVDVYLLSSNNEGNYFKQTYNNYINNINNSKEDVSYFNKYSNGNDKLYNSKKIFTIKEDCNVYSTDLFGCAYLVYNNNRFYYNSNPHELSYNITDVQLNQTYNKINEVIVNNIISDRMKVVKDFFFDNLQLIMDNYKFNPILTNKENKYFEQNNKDAYDFYTSNHKVINNNDKQLRGLFKTINMYSKSFNLNYDDAVSLYNENSNIYNSLYGFYFNLCLLDDKTKNWITERINPTDYAKYKLFGEVKNIVKNGTYDFNELKTLLSNIDSNIFKKAGYKIDSNNDVKFLLKVCFDVENKRVRINKEQKSIIIISDYKIPQELHKYKLSLLDKVNIDIELFVELFT